MIPWPLWRRPIHRLKRRTHEPPHAPHPRRSLGLFSIANRNSPIPPLQNTTNHYNPQPAISGQQRKAILHILAGKPDAAVAYALGVHRVTVTHWRLRNPAFQDELHPARQQLWNAELDKLRALLAGVVLRFMPVRSHVAGVAPTSVSQ